MCVPTLPRQKRIVNFLCVQPLILVLFPQNFFRSKAKFFTGEEDNVKNTCCSLASYLLVSCSETNHATDAMKEIVHEVDMKFRKLKKNNVRNTNKS